MEYMDTLDDTVILMNISGILRMVDSNQRIFKSSTRLDIGKASLRCGLEPKNRPNFGIWPTKILSYRTRNVDIPSGKLT